MSGERHRPGRSARLGSALAAAVLAGGRDEARALVIEIRSIDARRQEPKP